MGNLLPWAANGSPAYEDWSTSALNPTTTFTATASATPHTKGTWTELVTAADFEVGLINLVANSAVFGAGVLTSILCDIGIGASSSEKVIVPNLNYAGCDARTSVWCPVRIPKGSRIAYRIQGLVVSETLVALRPVLIPASAHTSPGNVCTTYGADTATSKGVPVIWGAGAWGAWTEITSSTTAPGRWAVLTAGIDTTTATAQTGGFQLGIGAGGSEKIVVPYALVGTVSANEGVTWARFGTPFPVDIPIGSRLAVRGWSGSAVTDINVCVHLFG